MLSSLGSIHGRPSKELMTPSRRGRPEERLRVGRAQASTLRLARDSTFISSCRGPLGTTQSTGRPEHSRRWDSDERITGGR